MIAMAFTGILAGALFGYVLQHGRFCMNTAFRETILSRDFTVFRAYILALLISILGANLLDHLGVISLRPASFTWFANAVGGYVFGLAMVLGGGCASGTLYRIGEGLLGSWFTAFGFMMGAAATLAGFLRPVAEWFWFGPGYDPADPSSAKFAYIPMSEEGSPIPVTLYSMIGINRWIVIAVVGAAAIIFIAKGNFKKTVGQKGFTWWTTGILIGVVSTLGFLFSGLYGNPVDSAKVQSVQTAITEYKAENGAFPASLGEVSDSLPISEKEIGWFNYEPSTGIVTAAKGTKGGEARGLSFTGPLNEFLQWFAGSSQMQQVKNIATENELELPGSVRKAGVLTWSVFMIFGVVLGSLFSAWRSGEFGFRAPKAQVLAQQFGAGIVMGFSGTMAGGCNVGHGLTGLSTLALGSLVGIIFIILGCWTMVYFLFIRE